MERSGEARSGRTFTGPITGADRYRLWTGASGRRHVFTRLETPPEPDDLEDAVVLVARREGDGGLRRTWLGDGARLPGGIEAGQEVHVHWLAESAAARAAVIADLGGTVVGERGEPGRWRAGRRAA